MSKHKCIKCGRKTNLKDYWQTSPHSYDSRLCSAYNCISCDEFEESCYCSETNKYRAKRMRRELQNDIDSLAEWVNSYATDSIKKYPLDFSELLKGINSLHQGNKK